MGNIPQQIWLPENSQQQVALNPPQMQPFRTETDRSDTEKPK